MYLAVTLQLIPVGALGGYLFAKHYTNIKLRKYSDEGGFGATNASSADREPGQRSVNRRL
jgi:hypothetical protein